MPATILHIGTPRTGTTVIQKHLLPKCRRSFIVSKRAYSSSGNIRDNQKPLIGYTTKEEIRQSLQANKPEEINSTKHFINNIMTPLVQISRGERDKEVEHLICLAVKQLIQVANNNNLLLSSERICDCSASLRGDSQHTQSDEEFLVHALSRVCTKANGQTPLISICFREAISYLRSKYIRTAILRHQGKLKKISPKEYIQKQATLESDHPGTSALTPAMHAEFIKQLQQHAFVKAFGFQELLASDDVFSLMGLPGEDKYAFRDFPRENKLPFTKEQEQAIEIEITEALKQYGFYDQIMKAQMFE
ncbi:hypothetical protein [Synechococcus sp. UW69]|uniref:hypothetical protein n=1 Tax=Synechococcus sp. UW69 TaxID=368493 RepID=UPI0010BDD061|nr:hypothetical protein [Synechococcus sp. UW69]